MTPPIDHKFTEKIKQWLEKPEDERDYSVGALYLLKLSGGCVKIGAASFS